MLVFHPQHKCINPSGIKIHHFLHSNQILTYKWVIVQWRHNDLGNTKEIDGTKSTYLSKRPIVSQPVGAFEMKFCPTKGRKLGRSKCTTSLRPIRRLNSLYITRYTHMQHLTLCVFLQLSKASDAISRILSICKIIVVFDGYYI